MSPRIARFSISLLLAAIPVAIYGFSSGPVVRRTGAPVDGGLDCTACHRTFGPANTGLGKVTIKAAPYTPGARQTVSVTVEDPEAVRWGFQLTARLKSDETKQAGTFTPNEFVRVRCDPDGAEAPCNGAPEFPEHTVAATRPGTRGSSTFEMQWTPPATNVGDIVFYAAGNAANNNAAFTGDHIYTANLIVSPATANTKPAISSQSGVVNGASFQPAISPNAWITIKGTSLASSTRTWINNDFSGNKLPTQLDGVSVTVNGKPAYVYYISPTQLNVLAPPDAAEGPVPVEVTKNGVKSDPVTAQIQKFSPAFFLFSAEDRKYIAATHANNTFLGKSSLYPGLSTPAKPGETIVLYGTGFGQTDPATPAGEIVSTALKLPTLPTVRFGGVAAEVVFAGLSSAGVYQLNVKVPDSVPDGDIAVLAEIGGLRSQENAFITVQK